jgi:hypothetical protein
MVEVTNTTRRPRTVNTVKGRMTLAPGESRDLEMTEVAAKKYETFGRMHSEPGKDPALRPVISIGKGKLAPAPKPTPQEQQEAARANAATGRHKKD